jgi:hypothetical protein
MTNDSIQGLVKAAAFNGKWRLKKADKESNFEAEWKEASKDEILRHFFLMGYSLEKSKEIRKLVLNIGRTLPGGWQQIIHSIPYPTNNPDYPS